MSTDKKEKNWVIITQDGWVFVIDHGKQIGLGDIDVDCEVVDLRAKAVTYTRKNEDKRREHARSLMDAGLSYREVAKEVGVSYQTVYNWMKKYEKEKNTGENKNLLQEEAR